MDFDMRGRKSSFPKWTPKLPLLCCASPRAKEEMRTKAKRKIDVAKQAGQVIAQKTYHVNDVLVLMIETKGVKSIQSKLFTPLLCVCDMVAVGSTRDR